METDCIKKELTRCLSCRAKPCERACPLGVSPHDFIKASKEGDYKQAAALIAEKNPLPQTCGLICPDRFCQAACIRKKIDSFIKIPCLQAEIMRRGGYPAIELQKKHETLFKKKAAVVGGGAAGLGAVHELIRAGWLVDLYEKKSILGGAMRLIPEYRLPKTVLDFEIERLINNDRTTVYLNTEITDFNALKEQYDGVILTLGETTPRTLGIKGEEHCIPYAEFLSAKKEQFFPSAEPEKMPRVAVVGGGEVALDCALSAVKRGSAQVEMFVRRRREDMRIQTNEYDELNNAGIIIRELTSITEISSTSSASYCLKTIKNTITAEGKPEASPKTEDKLEGYNIIIQALGSYFPKENIPEGFILAGDMTRQSGTAVEALASGRDAALKLIKGNNE